MDHDGQINRQDIWNKCRWQVVCALMHAMSDDCLSAMSTIYHDVNYQYLFQWHNKISELAAPQTILNPAWFFLNAKRKQFSGTAFGTIAPWHWLDDIDSGHIALIDPTKWTQIDRCRLGSGAYSRWHDTWKTSVLEKIRRTPPSRLAASSWSVSKRPPIRLAGS